MEISFGDQLEEGEIVDDDENFEAISDDSIIDCTFGKLAPNKDHLRALSLSSSSASGKNNNKIESCNNRKHHKRKDKKYTSVFSSSSSSSSNKSSDDDSKFYKDSHIKRKLKEAIHISGTVNNEAKKSLQSRLQLMSKLAPKQLDDDSELLEPPPPPQITESEPSSQHASRIDDSELENLRLEALKTAILNKVARRKRRKALQLDQQVETLDNKENDSQITPLKDVLEDSTNKKPCLEHNTDESTNKSNTNINTEIEDLDEDVLRAELLRTMAKKITKKIPTVTVEPPSQKVDVVSARMRPGPVSIKRTIPTSLAPTRLVKKPQIPIIKPLIIRVNGDSDSDSDVAKVPPKTMMTDDKIDRFLKEQWSQWKSSSRVEVAETSEILEKSAVKLLPKSQQLEYQQLLKKLKTAERKIKVKRLQTISRSTVVAKVQPPQAVLLPTSLKPLPPPKNEIAIVLKVDAATETDDLEDESQSKTVTASLTVLRKALKDMRTPRNDGSLQMKKIYQGLTPVMRKITQASNERKKYEKRIKELTKLLDEAKINLENSHEKFSGLVHDFVEKKSQIDLSLTQLPPRERTDHLTTSTPRNSIVQPFDECAISSLNQSDRSSEDMDICNGTSEEFETEIDIVDPNDIDQIFKRRRYQPEENKVPEYISPLNYYAKYDNVDPHGIMCPYEVNGSCRDTECSFKHYLKDL